MTTQTYADVLQLALEALHSGEDLEAVLVRFPEHAEALRDDLALTGAVADLSRTVPPSREGARTGAASRLQAQLQESRAAAPRRARVPWWSFSLPRLALATAIAALAVIGFAFISGGGNGSVQAATLEGVVLENDGDSLTVQTLDALEQVTVPADALVSDVAGVSIALDGITVGEVVVINAQLADGSVVAQRIQRLADGIDAWCTDRSDRCAMLAEQLDRAAQQCDRQPGTCRVLLERVHDLRLRATDIASLEDLRARCRAGNEAACQDLVSFCRQHDAICGDFAPVVPVPSDAQDTRLRDLYSSCRHGDEAACRQLASVCSNHPGLCPTDVPIAPAETPVPDRPAPTPTSLPNDVRPTLTPTPELREPQPVGTPVREPQPTATLETTDAPSTDTRPANDDPAPHDAPSDGDPQTSDTPGGHR